MVPRNEKAEMFKEQRETLHEHELCTPTWTDYVYEEARTHTRLKFKVGTTAFIIFLSYDTGKSALFIEGQEVQCSGLEFHDVEHAADVALHIARALEPATPNSVTR